MLPRGVGMQSTSMLRAVYQHLSNFYPALGSWVEFQNVVKFEGSRHSNIMTPVKYHPVYWEAF